MERLLAEVPALMLVGPRATGKTTTASRYARTVVSLDKPAEAAAFEADPDVALRGLQEPVLIDEWQAVPGVLGALKRSIDADPKPGRYLVTGSVRANLEAETWPGTGRLLRLSLLPMTTAEQQGRPDVTPLLDRLARGAELTPAKDTPDLMGYLELALKGGYPEAVLTLSAPIRQRWLESYTDQVLTRDAELVEVGRDPERLGRYFQACALNTAGVPEHKSLYDAAGINRKTAVAYDRLLENLMMTTRLQAWSTNRLKRLTRSPRRYLIDASLLSGILHLDATAVLRDGDLMGRVLDTFAAAQLRVEHTVSESRARLYHLREQNGLHEVDIIAELGTDSVIALEVKATSAPGKKDARHLSWLRDKLGDRFVAGVLLHTGPRSFKLEDRITAAPISTLWA
ncbi:ATP-binding protein [Candidatus Zixiibacteriota bacterium]